MKKILKIAMALVLLTPLMSYAADSEKCLQSTLFYESNTEGFEAMLAVGSVVMKRADGNIKNVCKVVKERNQFSWVGLKPIKLFKQAEVVSQLLKGGMIHPRFKNATHFHDVSIHPTWANKMKYLGRVKRLKFYEEI